MRTKWKGSFILSLFSLFLAEGVSSSEGVSPEVESVSADILEMLTSELSFRSREVKPGDVEGPPANPAKHQLHSSFDFFSLRNTIIEKMKGNSNDYFNANEQSGATLNITFVANKFSTNIMVGLINENKHSNITWQPRDSKVTYPLVCSDEFGDKLCVVCKKHRCDVSYNYGDTYREPEFKQALELQDVSDSRLYHDIQMRSNVYSGYDSISLIGNEPALRAVVREARSTPFNYLVPAGEYNLTGKAEYGFYEITEVIVVSSERTIDLEFKRIKPGERIDVVNDCIKECPELIFIPTLKFVMGGYKDNEKPHRELKPEPFLISRYEVTVGEFKEFVDDTKYETDAEKKGYCKVQGNIVDDSERDSGFIQSVSSFLKGLNKGDDDKEVKKSTAKRGRRFFEKSNSYWDNPGFEQTENHPVVCVSWNDAQAYLKWLSGKTYRNYRLPTEVEWEYAARATSSTKYSWGDSLPVCDTNAKNGANFDDGKQCGDSGTVNVGSYQKNKLDLYDMHGNVHEWVQDCSQKNERYGDPTTIAVEPKDCLQRIVRGGSWNSPADSLRSAFRGFYNQDTPASNTGFRVVRDAFSASVK